MKKLLLIVCFFLSINCEIFGDSWLDLTPTVTYTEKTYKNVECPRVNRKDLADKDLRVVISTKPNAKYVNGYKGSVASMLCMTYIRGFKFNVNLDYSDNEVYSYSQIRLNDSEVNYFIESPTIFLDKTDESLINLLKTHDISFKLQYPASQNMTVENCIYENTENPRTSYFEFIPEPLFNYYLTYEYNKCKYGSHVNITATHNNKEVINVSDAYVDRFPADSTGFPGIDWGKGEFKRIPIHVIPGVINRVEMSMSLDRNEWVNAYVGLEKIKSVNMSLYSKFSELGDNTMLPVSINYKVPNDGKFHARFLVNGVEYLNLFDIPDNFAMDLRDFDGDICITPQIVNSDNVVVYTGDNLEVNKRDLLNIIKNEPDSNSFFIIDNSNRYIDKNNINSSLIDDINNTTKGIYVIMDKDKDSILNELIVK